ncbi:MAG: response regulator [bacterium]|nr:response regulator [bacterium]
MPSLPGSLFPAVVPAWLDIGEIVLAAGLVGVVAALVRYRSALRRARADGERQFRGLVEAAPFGIVVHDPEKVRYLNGCGRQVLGLAADGSPGREACGDLLTVPATGGAASGSKDTSVNTRIRTVDGRTLELQVVSIDSEFDRRPARLTFFRDITAELDARRELADSRERLALALEAARDGVWDLDPLSGAVDGSAAFTDVLHPGGPTIRSADAWLALVHPGDREDLERARAGAATAGTGYECEVRLLRPDGGVAWVLERGRAVTRVGTDGSLRLAGTVRDITARKRAERRLALRGRLAAAFLAARGDFLRANLGTLLQEFVEAPGSCVGMYDTGGRLRMACNCRDASAPATNLQLAPEAVPAAWRRVLEATGPVIIDDAGTGQNEPCSPLLGVRLVSGDRVLGLVAVAGRESGYRRDDEENLAGIAADLAPLVLAHLEAEAKDAQLAQAQKMEALGVLAGGIAHDFNNILQAILGFSSLARQDANDPGRLAADLDRVQRATVRGRDLVQRILQFSRPGDPEAPALDPVPLLEEIVIELRTTLPGHITVEPVLAADCGLVRAAATQLRQALMNLAANAGQAMAASGGTIRVSARSWTVAADDRRLPPDWNGREVVEIAVADTGPGIPEDHRARLFDPFFTTREVGQGSGLGLSVVHGLVTGLGGRVVIDCPASGGTIAAVYLPRMDAHGPATGADRPTAAATSAGGRRGRVLFVDDDPEIRDLAVALLGRAGYEVETEADGLCAAERLAGDPGGFDVVVTDQYMPGLTGRELAQRVAALRPDLPVILVSGLDEPAGPSVAGGPVVREVVTKPFFGQSLCLAVRRALEGAPERPPSVPPLDRQGR